MAILTLNLRKNIQKSFHQKGVKLKLSRNLYNISLYKKYVFIIGARVLSSLWQLKVSIGLLLGKRKVGLFSVSLKIF